MGNPIHGPTLQDPQPHVILERPCPRTLRGCRGRYGVAAWSVIAAGASGHQESEREKARPISLGPALPAVSVAHAARLLAACPSHVQARWRNATGGGGKMREEGALGPAVTLSRPGDPSEGIARCVSSAWAGQLAPLLGRGRCCGCSAADSSGDPRLLVKGQFRALHDRHLCPRLQLSKGSWSDANALGLTRGRLARASWATARRGSPKTSTSTTTSSTDSTTQRVPVRSGIAPDSANSVTPPVRSPADAQNWPIMRSRPSLESPLPLHPVVTGRNVGAEVGRSPTGGNAQVARQRRQPAAVPHPPGG